MHLFSVVWVDDRSYCLVGVNAELGPKMKLGLIGELTVG